MWIGQKNCSYQLNGYHLHVQVIHFSTIRQGKQREVDWRTTLGNTHRLI